MHPFLSVLLPELSSFPPDRRSGALGAAQATELDALELAGAAIVLVVVTWVTGGGSAGAQGIAARLLATLMDFALALPLLAAGFLPLHLRRLRRGLRAQLRDRGSA